MDRESFKGVFVIVVTPFTETLDLDEDGLRRVLNFCLESGVQGVVASAMASEGPYLTESERRRVAEITVEEAQGKAVTVVAVSSSNIAPSVAFARHAAGIGADAIMAMPPNVHKPTAAETKSFYAALADASGLPIVIQNAIGPGATPLSPAQMVDIARDVPSAGFIKEETEFPGAMTTEILAIGEGVIHGVMGGKAGVPWLEESRRGSCGTMPACEFADVHESVWQALTTGDTKEARRIFRQLLPLLNFESTYGVPMAKEVLRRRGVIDCAAWRQTGRPPLDRHAMAELDVLLEEIAPFMLQDFRPVS